MQDVEPVTFSLEGESLHFVPDVCQFAENSRLQKTTCDLVSLLGF